MGLLDAILGRSKPVRPDLDQLFGAAVGRGDPPGGGRFRPTGLGSVCFASVEGGAFARIQEDVRELLDADTGRGGVPVEFSQDAYGYTWLLARQPPDDVAALVNDLHAVNTLLEEAGFGPQLLCSLVGFREAAGSVSLALVYLYKRGTFYPFAPLPGRREKRDNAAGTPGAGAARGRSEDRAGPGRWFPVWGAPGLDGTERGGGGGGGGVGEGVGG